MIARGVPAQDKARIRQALSTSLYASAYLFADVRWPEFPNGVLTSLDDKSIVSLLRAPLRTTSEAVTILRALRLNATAEHERTNLRREMRMGRFGLA